MEVLHNGPELVFLYQLVNGSTSSSYACHIASLAGVPEVIVKRGREASSSYTVILHFVHSYWLIYLIYIIVDPVGRTNHVIIKFSCLLCLRFIFFSPKNKIEVV